MAEALEKIETETPDLMILDIVMPDVNGFEVCRRVKMNPATKDLPVIFCSIFRSVCVPASCQNRRNRPGVAIAFSDKPNEKGAHRPCFPLSGQVGGRCGSQVNRSLAQCKRHTTTGLTQFLAEGDRVRGKDKGPGWWADRLVR